MRIALILFIAGFATLATAGPVVFRVSDPVNPGETALLFGDGIGPDATHTIADNEQPGLPMAALGAIRHPETIAIDAAADRRTYDYRHDGIKRRFPRNLKPVPRRVAGAIYRYARRTLGF